MRYNLIWEYCIDLLRSCITYPDHDLPLFSFVCNSLVVLDKTARPSFFPIVFSLKLLRLLGFDMNIETNIENSFANLAHSSAVQELLTQTNYELCADLQIAHSEKQQLFTQIMQHYCEYVPNFKTPNSIEIIRDILG